MKTIEFIRIEKETEKAMFIALNEDVSIWVPKSLLTIDGNSLTVPEWFYKKDVETKIEASKPVRFTFIEIKEETEKATCFVLYFKKFDRPNTLFKCTKAMWIPKSLYTIEGDTVIVKSWFVEKEGEKAVAKMEENFKKYFFHN
jgi:hypothetical protein